MLLISGLSLANFPSEARTLWLRCGTNQINLDTSQGQYQARVANRIYSGQPQVDARTVALTINWSSNSGDDRMVYRLVIDRSTLAYTQMLMARLPSPTNGEYWDTLEQQRGRCNLMTNSYSGKTI